MSFTRETIIFFGTIFALKVLDNIFDSMKVICLQKNHSILAGVCLSCSAFLNYYVIKIIAQSEGVATMSTAAIAAGVGCWVAGMIGTRFFHGTHVKVIMSDDKEAIKTVHEFLSESHIKHTIADTYNKELSEKTLTITAFPNTLSKSRKIKGFVKNNPAKLVYIE